MKTLIGILSLLFLQATGLYVGDYIYYKQYGHSILHTQNKLLQHDKVKLISGEYKDCTAEMALDEDDNQGKEENNDKYALRNIVCYYEGGIRITVFTLTWIPKVDVEKAK